MTYYQRMRQMEFEEEQLVSAISKYGGKIISRGTDDTVISAIQSYLPKKRYKSLDLHVVFDAPDAAIRAARIRFRSLKDMMQFLNEACPFTVYTFTVSYNI